MNYLDEYLQRLDEDAMNPIYGCIETPFTADEFADLIF